MKLITKIAVNYNSGAAGTASGIVEGVLQDGQWLNEFTKVGSNYSYLDPEGQPFFKSAFTIEGDDIQIMYNAVKGLIPEGLDFRKEQEFLFYFGFMFEMAKTFGINTSDIEIVE